MIKGDTSDPRGSPAWPLLVEHSKRNARLKLSELLDGDAARYSRFSLELDDLLVDFSRCLATDETLDLLLQLAEQRQLPLRIQDLYRGALLNSTEGRAALHTALRGTGPAEVAGSASAPGVADLVTEQLDLFLQFADAVRDGTRLGFTGQRISRVINIGIGGSDLGPRLVADALADKREDFFFQSAMLPE